MVIHLEQLSRCGVPNGTSYRLWSFAAFLPRDLVAVPPCFAPGCLDLGCVCIFQKFNEIVTDAPKNIMGEAFGTRMVREA